jgi:hypothetical protein
MVEGLRREVGMSQRGGFESRNRVVFVDGNPLLLFI